MWNIAMTKQTTVQTRRAMQPTINALTCLGLLTLLLAASPASAEVEDGVQTRHRGAVHGGYQMADYSLGGAEMDVAGAYLALAGSVFSDWLEVEVSIGYSVGDSEELKSALVSDLETVNLNAVLKPTYHIDNFSVYGKAGLNYSTVYYSVGWGLWTTSAFGGVFGGGASYDFDNGIGLHAEVLSYVGTDSIEYDGPSDGSAQGGDIDYSPEIRIGLSYSF